MAHEAARTRPGRAASLLVVVLLAALLGATSLAAAAPGAQTGATPAAGSLAVPSEIEGTARFLGCTPDPSQLRIVAEPLSFGSPGQRRFTPDSNTALHQARLVATSDPHVLDFSIHGLQPHVLYRIGATYPEDACGKLFWRGPFQGLAVAGGGPVALEGIAARTAVEVRRRGTDEWLGTDELRFMDARAGERQFRWRSTISDVVGGELQIAIEPFPIENAFDPCAEPESGLVLRRQVAASQSAWVDIGSVDFNSVLSPRRIGGDGDTGEVSRIDERTLRRLVAGQPLYVRVIPHTPDGPACDPSEDGASGWVVLGNVVDEAFAGGPAPVASKLAPGDGSAYTPPYTGGDAQGHPALGEFGYKVIKDHKLPETQCYGIIGSILADEDPLGCVIVNAGWREPGTILEKGPWFFFAPASSSGGGGFNPIGAIGSTVLSLTTAGSSALGLLVETASAAYADIKAAVVEVVVKVIETIPGGQDACDAIASHTPTSCESIVETGITVAMSSVGMPPSIPNWQQLKEQGIEYVSAEIATEISNETGGVIPPEVTQEVLEDLAREALEEMEENRAGSDPKYDWVLPYAGFEPASALVSVNKSGTDPSPENLVLGLPTTPLFRSSYLEVPRVFPPDGTIRIPVVLQPRLAGFNAPLCKSSWYTNPQVQCLGVLPEGAAPVCMSQSNSGSDVQKNPYKPYDCKYANYPALYYRDRWVNERLDAVTGCTSVAATTVQWNITGGDPNNPFDMGVEYLAPPLDWRFTVFAAVKPRVPAVWNGPTHNAC